MSRLYAAAFVRHECEAGFRKTISRTNMNIVFRFLHMFMAWGVLWLEGVWFRVRGPWPRLKAARRLKVDGAWGLGGQGCSIPSQKRAI